MTSICMLIDELIHVVEVRFIALLTQWKLNGIIEYEDILDNFKVTNSVTSETLIKWTD